MSEYSDSKPYHFLVLEDSSMPRGASGRSSMAQLHQMAGYSQGGADLGLPSDGSDSSGQDPPGSLHNHRKNARSRSLPEEDVEMKSSGSSGSGTESHGNESHGNESHGHESVGSSNGNSKDSALLESSESNKRSVVNVGIIKSCVDLYVVQESCLWCFFWSQRSDSLGSKTHVDVTFHNRIVQSDQAWSSCPRCKSLVSTMDDFFQYLLLGRFKCDKSFKWSPYKIMSIRKHVGGLCWLPQYTV